jgi:hypothetical protein
VPLTTADVPDPSKKPEAPKVEPPKPPEKTGLADAALSSDPLVQKLLWDRGHRHGAGDAHMVAVIDGELRKLGFDL